MSNWTRNTLDSAEGLDAFDKLNRLVEHEENILHSASEAAYSHEGRAVLDSKEPGLIGDFNLYHVLV